MRGVNDEIEVEFVSYNFMKEINLFYSPVIERGWFLKQMKWFHF